MERKRNSTTAVTLVSTGERCPFRPNQLLNPYSLGRHRPSFHLQKWLKRENKEEKKKKNTYWSKHFLLWSHTALNPPLFHYWSFQLFYWLSNHFQIRCLEQIMLTWPCWGSTTLLSFFCDNEPSGMQSPLLGVSYSMYLGSSVRILLERLSCIYGRILHV